MWTASIVLAGLKTCRSCCAGAFGALLPPDGNWTLALQDMRLSMNVTSRGNSRKDIFALQSANSTFTRYVCRSDTMRCNNVTAVNFDFPHFWPGAVLKIPSHSSRAANQLTTGLTCSKMPITSRLSLV